MSRSRRALRPLLALAALLAVAGCGIRPTGIIDAGEAPAANGAAAEISVYLVRDGKLRRVTRPGVPGQPYLAVEQLGVPPTERERAAGLRTEIGRALDAYLVSTASDRDDERSTLVVRPTDPLSRPPGWSRIAVAQIACTGQAIPGIERINLWGAPNADKTGWGLVRCDQFDDLRS
ncbi:hypothetical protein [Actinomadura sp. 9N215]|uniref:hypothetical protein n=1 Tax=Actinomadura sp. 9N215 TaxID=3375150 RepID=UPI00379F1B97